MIHLENMIILIYPINKPPRYPDSFIEHFLPTVHFYHTNTNDDFIHQSNSFIGKTGSFASENWKWKRNVDCTQLILVIIQ